MLPDRVSNPGPPTYESGVLPIALRGPAKLIEYNVFLYGCFGIHSFPNADIRISRRDARKCYFQFKDL